MLGVLAEHLQALDPPRLAGFIPSDTIMLDDWERNFDLAADVAHSSWEKFSIHDPPGVKVYEGWARFRTRLEIPPEWCGQDVLLRCEAIGDAFIVTDDGQEVGRAGNITGTWDGTRDRPQEFALRLAAGAHSIIVDVRDWRGNGGMAGPVYLTRTADATVY